MIDTKFELEKCWNGLDRAVHLLHNTISPDSFVGLKKHEANESLCEQSIHFVR